MYTDNILTCYMQSINSEVSHGKTWYADAKQDAQDMADKYELPLNAVVGVIAALSPTNKWERNLIDAIDMIQSFTGGGYVEDCAPCTYKTMRDKAWSILELGPCDNDAIATVLNGPKITDFFWCIMGKNVCVVDGHAWCIANADRRTMQEVPNIGKKLRLEIQQAYADAGKRVGLTAYQMQAATWVTWRRLHGVK
jgi:hypothetical protein